MHKWLLNILAIKTDFQQLFFNREYQTLKGASTDKFILANKEILKLVGILFLTLIALGLSLGGLQKLEKRMNNPFTNWVNVPVSYKVEKHFTTILTRFENEALKDSFLLNNISNYTVTRKQFIHATSGQTYNQKGRTVNSNSALLRKILSDKEGNVIVNWVGNDSVFKDYPCGIIVTKSMLENLGYINPLSQKKIILKDDSGYTIFIEVLAIVKELPDLCDFLTSPVLYNLLIKAMDETGFIEQTGTSNILHFVSSTNDVDELEAKVKGAITDYKLNKIKTQSYSINESENHWYHQLIFTRSFPISKSLELFEKIDIANSFYLTKWNCNQRFDYIQSPDYLAFNFNQLDKIKMFKNHTEEVYDIEVDMNQIEAKENFALVSRLSRFTLLALFVFSLASILFFINSLLEIHLEKIKPNIGTFKAFGLSNKFLTSSYLKIIGVFILLSTFLAFIGALCAKLIDVFLGLKSNFILFDLRIGVAFIFLLLLSLLFSMFTINRILKETPGNLIYGRSNS